MLGFMDYVQNAFYQASRWDRDNSYGTLTATSRSAQINNLFNQDPRLTLIDILDFSTPEGLRFHVSSLSSPNFATSYTLGSIGLVDGSLSYLYSSLPLSRLAAKSSAIDLHHLVPGYRQLQDLRQPDEPWWWEIWHQGKRIDRRGQWLSQAVILTLSLTVSFNRSFALWPFVPASFYSRSSLPPAIKSQDSAQSFLR